VRKAPTAKTTAATGKSAAATRHPTATGKSAAPTRHPTAATETTATAETAATAPAALGKGRRDHEGECERDEQEPSNVSAYHRASPRVSRLCPG
jgi:hypothetical protein